MHPMGICGLFSNVLGCGVYSWFSLGNMMDDRIKLAEAMNRKSPGFRLWDENDVEIQHPDFYPDTNANDDYSVLVWMRPDDWINSVPIKGPDHARYRDFIFELRLLELEQCRPSGPISQGYQIGDYARAALNVIE